MFTGSATLISASGRVCAPGSRVVCGLGGTKQRADLAKRAFQMRLHSEQRHVKASHDGSGSEADDLALVDGLVPVAEGDSGGSLVGEEVEAVDDGVELVLVAHAGGPHEPVGLEMEGERLGIPW